MSNRELEAQTWEALLSRHSAAEALALAKECVQEPDRLAVVAEASASEAPTVRAFAFHVLKQVATLDEGLLAPYRETVLAIGRPGEYWTIPLLSAQAVARMPWPPDWHARVQHVFEPYLAGQNKFAAAWALRALWPIAEPGSPLQRRLLKACDRFLAQGGAPAASAKIILRKAR